MGSRPGAVVAPSIISSGNSGELNGDGNCCLKEVAIVKNHKNNKNNKKLKIRIDRRNPRYRFTDKCAM